MKTAIITQQELEQKAIDAMIVYGKNYISLQEMSDAIANALRHYGDAEGHAIIVLRGWIVKTIYALNREQLRELERAAFSCINNPQNNM